MCRSVVDTMVLRKANAPLNNTPKAGRQFAKRVALLRKFADGEQTLLFSQKLIREYSEQVPEPRNEFVKLFLQLLTDGTAVHNWPRWTRGIRQNMFHCRFPTEDEHVLRTAWCDGDRSVLYSEEGRMMRSRDCVRREFNVDIVDPVAT